VKPRHALLARAVLPIGLSLALQAAPAAAEGSCTNEALRAPLHSTELPDCRAYELVSPVVKYGWPIVMSRVASNGDSAVAFSLGGLPGSNQSSLINFYKLVRVLDGWKTVPLNTPLEYVNSGGGASLPAASPDLSHGVFEYRSATTVDRRDTNFYVDDLLGGPPNKVGPRISPDAFASVPATETLNSSAPSAPSDLSRVLYMLNGPEYPHGTLVDYLWPGDATAQRSLGIGWTSLYEYVGTSNSVPSLVGVDGGHLISQCGTALGYPEGGRFSSLVGDEVYNAVSAPGGTRVFFTVAAGPCEEGAGPPANELYASEEQSPGARLSVAISEPTAGAGGDCSACNTSAPQSAIFQGASEDGSKVFFLSEQAMLGGAGGQNLYEYDFNAPKGRRVVLVAPGVLGVARVAENGSHVYFVDENVLTAAANPVGDLAQAGADNLYVYDTATTETSFVGTLATGDGADWQTRDERPVNATPDGRFLVFAGRASLTPGDAGGLSQVYEYDAQKNTLIQVSRAEGGPGGEFATRLVYPRYTGNFDPSPQQSSVSDDGAYVVFQSEAALTPHAILGYNNVYEYHAGHVSLISDGQDHSFGDGGVPSVSLFGIDGSGRDIFFTTADELSPQDGDTQEDVYDARIGGGFLPASPAACEGDGCQGVLSAPPSFSAPESLTPSAGNLTPPSRTSPAPKPKPLTNAQKLAKALKACRVKHNRHKRTACEKQAKRKYGALKATHRSPNRRATS
jgi:hypothetical protein